MKGRGISQSAAALHLHVETCLATRWLRPTSFLRYVTPLKRRWTNWWKTRQPDAREPDPHPNKFGRAWRTHIQTVLTMPIQSVQTTLWRTVANPGHAHRAAGPRRAPSARGHHAQCAAAPGPDENPSRRRAACVKGPRPTEADHISHAPLKTRSVRKGPRPTEADHISHAPLKTRSTRRRDEGVPSSAC